MIPVMLVVATVAFVLTHLAPGDPASVIAGPYATADDVAKQLSPARLSGLETITAAIPVQLAPEDIVADDVPLGLPGMARDR